MTRCNDQSPDPCVDVGESTEAHRRFEKMAAVSSNPNEKILLYEEVIDDAMDLCRAGSESYALLQALRDVRFHGADPAQTRAGLTCETGLNFKVIARDVVTNMKSYGSQCDQNRRNVSSRSKKTSDPKSTEPNIVGGGMALHEEALEALIDFADDEGDKDLAQLLDALRRLEDTDWHAEARNVLALV